ncbi:hypothetical protein FJTKL_02115 [Diaporthe vaccinii]|uniref:Uncharacterized protein n=1 Tax=Diaporthe vaccinii TaxID=105482 RepID=A0ABR4DZ08_9PEZI
MSSELFRVIRSVVIFPDSTTFPEITVAPKTASAYIQRTYACVTSDSSRSAILTFPPPLYGHSRLPVLSMFTWTDHTMDSSSYHGPRCPVERWCPGQCKILNP